MHIKALAHSHAAGAAGPPDEAQRGWILYDGQCAFCSNWTHFWKNTLRRRGFELAPLQARWVAERLALAPDKLMYDLRLLTADGELVNGANVYLYVARRIWWAWPLFALFSLPGFNCLLHRGYRWFARNRYCVSGTCKLPGRSNRIHFVAWLPLVLLPVLVIAFTQDSPGWVQMWAVVFAIFSACKWLSFYNARADFFRDSFPRALAFLLLWPGMDPAPFVSCQKSARTFAHEWLSAICQTLFGMALVWFVSPQLSHILLHAWAGATGILFLLHFGLFRLLALTFRANGITAEPLMRTPALACSLADFWSARWNRGFSDLAHAFVFRPLQKRSGPRMALLAGFAVSGLIHELVISLPARGGFGGPSLYFLLQGIGVLLERSRAGRRAGLNRGIRGWLWMAIFTALPLGWLFHPLFMLNVILPFLKAIGA